VRDECWPEWGDSGACGRRRRCKGEAVESPAGRQPRRRAAHRQRIPDAAGGARPDPPPRPVDRQWWGRPVRGAPWVA